MKSFKENENNPPIVQAQLLKRQKRNRLLLFFIFFLLIGITLCIIYSTESLISLKNTLAQENYLFYWMILAGCGAEIIAGSMGMGYGVICATILLIMNVDPRAISGSIHASEMVTAAAGSISHFKLKNMDKELIKRLLIPAIIGTVIGALLLLYLGNEGNGLAKLTKPFIAMYTIVLGFKILRNGFRGKVENKEVKTIPLGLFAGFVDAFTGGGWGPLVTSSFIKNGHTPRYVIGVSTFTNFAITVVSTIIFITVPEAINWRIALGLIIGGVVTAPISALVTSKLPPRKIFFIIGFLIIIMGFTTIYKAIF
ncbi:sulfite exporter TauE/SafE family protein [Capnocytophaga sp. G2]|uniref:sulfite exporter TauE/SafE family protein n=1 Tax=Capnocytophaga sp. G2 TaxID=3110695 RepID=UPI002B473405|nr:sulfite exporter TauE/SafE family protein [Capnocytophaga sp. G2]MEB3004301.1 sulfite exporter TauE/SafE family protein [Capnocytophaga sp. G2]